MLKPKESIKGFNGLASTYWMSSLKDILIDSLNNKVRYGIDWIFTNGIIKLFKIKNINLLRLISVSEGGWGQPFL